ncbi:MAG: hypothetical protein JO277_14535 [Candidatus Eremiobacteraeota bacterium]|nr:hypothetical protein [Candidatus Eremiobacteraeota bacterium]
MALTLGLLAVCAAAAPSRDTATIVDSGSTNTAGYAIAVSSDGNSTVTPRNRMGESQSAPRSFTITTTLAAQFFADLKAARDGNATSVHCMKSASFGTSTHIAWHDWTSPDLDCPAGDALTSALIHDVDAIRAAGNVQTMLRPHAPSGPPRLLTGTPLPQATATPSP